MTITTEEPVEADVHLAAPSASILLLFTHNLCGQPVMDDTRLASTLMYVTCEKCKIIRLEGKG